jgi:hypothetical protein
MEMVALKEMVWRKKRKGERREGKNLFSCYFLPKKLWLRGEEP